MVAHEVVTDLHVGDASAALQPDVDAFDVIVNVTREVPFSKLLRPDQQVVRYDVLDDDASDQAAMATLLRGARVYVLGAVRAGRRVLVHCLEGKQRSCALVAACLMSLLGVPAEEACAIVRRAHPRAWDHGCYVHYREALAALDPSR